ncbi:RDD family protein [Wenxinia marina]|uniref:Putative membrane protein/domain protein n=1 Tax=Wenxinia marina DSM 24838 TaxID=1123501 RepID=A0A0D0PEC4_9RHOB|nr:RDD family protein [Wenxinia marina]KIQ69741.1 putative membrane protein/domain protein [Wenxinia marina DSM 24838]GGL60820.1 RDD family protein [Wenxinia marina]
MTTYSPLIGLPDPETRPEFYRGTAVKRAIAWVLDVTLIAILAVLVLPFTAFTGLFFFPMLMLVLGFVYRWLTLSGGSATWGMRLMGIEIRDRTGERLDSQTALLHTAGYTVSVLAAPAQLISAILMLVTPRGQGLTDMILGTAAMNRPLLRR